MLRCCLHLMGLHPTSYKAVQYNYYFCLDMSFLVAVFTETESRAETAKLMFKSSHVPFEHSFWLKPVDVIGQYDVALYVS